METFGERLKFLRIEKQLSLRRLADELGVGNTTVRSWENNLKEPTLSNIVKIAKYFQISMDYLGGLED